jgi:hypothetical protein
MSFDGLKRCAGGSVVDCLVRVSHGDLRSSENSYTDA